MILSLSSARDAVDEYFKLRRAFPLSELCEPSSFDVAHRSVLLNDLSLGSVCCDEATTDAPPAMASSESLYDASPMCAMKACMTSQRRFFEQNSLIPAVPQSGDVVRTTVLQTSSQIS
jgi:hypothetical protein